MKDEDVVDDGFGREKERETERKMIIFDVLDDCLVNFLNDLASKYLDCVCLKKNLQSEKVVRIKYNTKRVCHRITHSQPIICIILKILEPVLTQAGLQPYWLRYIVVFDLFIEINGGDRLISDDFEDVLSKTIMYDHVCDEESDYDKMGDSNIGESSMSVERRAEKVISIHMLLPRKILMSHLLLDVNSQGKTLNSSVFKLIPFLFALARLYLSDIILHILVEPKISHSGRDRSTLPTGQQAIPSGLALVKG
ncbi:hypothetical protein LXL04_016636 [Taraxacum kok-saghyz]